MHTNIKKFFPVFLLLSLPVMAQAADAAPAAGKASSGLNTVLIGLVSLIIVLIFVIGAAANVLKRLVEVWREKDLQSRSEGNTTIKSLLLMILAGFSAHTVLAAETNEVTQAVVNWDTKMVSGIPAFDFYVIMGIIALELLVILCLLLYIRIIIGILNARPELVPAVKKIARIPFWDRFNKVVAIEKEQDIMLDHDYDGIRELDNSLPPWWKYGFYLTIVIGVIYLWRFHVSETGPSSYQEYVAEVQQAEKEKAEYLAKSANNVDENTVTLLDDEAEIAAGQGLFEASCAACHAKDGGGGVGPNLADDYWLHGGSLQDVFKSIKYGWQDKGMKAWQDDFSPKQIAQLSTYIKKLKGTKPAAPKEKQGELYTEGNDGPPASPDSAKATVAIN